MDVPSAGFRALRAATFGVACVGLTAAAHHLGGGPPVPILALVAGFAATFAAGLAATRSERTLPTIAGGVLAGQAGLHLLFTALEPASAEVPAQRCPMRTGMPGMAGMSHDGAPADAMTQPAGAGWAGMVLAHIAAGLMVAWWLRRGEAAAWRLLRLVLALCPVPGAFPRILGGSGTNSACVRPVRSTPGRSLLVRIVRCAPRRGPPHGGRPVPITGPYLLA